MVGLHLYNQVIELNNSFSLQLKEELLAILRSIRATLRDYLWASVSAHTHARVKWADCHASRKQGGLGLIDLKLAVAALMSKWILKGLELGNSPLYVLLCYRLARIQRSHSSAWPQSLHWTLLPKFSTSRGTSLWPRILQAWRLTCPAIRVRKPVNYDEVRNIHLSSTSFFLPNTLASRCYALGNSREPDSIICRT